MTASRVAAIGAMKRRSGWLEIELENGRRFRIPRDEAAELHLSVGTEVSPSRLSRLERASARAEAMRVALRYLSVRPRSRRETELRLRRERLDAGCVEEVLARCEELGYLDDRDFAVAFARDRIRLRPSGVRRLESELIRRGVTREIALEGIADAMNEEGVSERDLLERAASRRAGRMGRLEPDVARRRLFSFLARRGFPASDARDWVAAWCEAAARRPGTRARPVAGDVPCGDAVSSTGGQDDGRGGDRHGSSRSGDAT